MHVIKIVQFNIGFVRDNPDGTQTSLVVDEHTTDNLETITFMDFVLYLAELKNYMVSKMDFITGRNSDIKKLKTLNLKTIDVNIYKPVTSVWDSSFSKDIGSLALLSVYDKDLFDKIGAFICEHDTTVQPLYTTGKDARNGISIFNRYCDIVNELFIPLFDVKITADAIHSMSCEARPEYINALETLIDRPLTQLETYNALESYMFDSLRLTAVGEFDSKKENKCRRDAIKYAVNNTRKFYVNQTELKSLLNT